MARVKRVLIWSFGLLLFAGLVYESIDFGELLFKVRRMENLADSASPDRFAAMSETTSDIYRFLVIGDNGAGTDGQREVANAMEKHCAQAEKIDGLLLLGDLIYPKGVQSVSDEKWQSLFMDYYRGESVPCLDAVPVYPVLGNHDYRGIPSSWILRSRQHPKWRFPGRSWSVQFGDILSVHGIDSNMVLWNGIPPLSQSAANDRWQIALGHHPVKSSSISGGRHRGGGFNGWFMNSRICGKFDAYFSGHAHHLEHRPKSSCSTDLFISGAGGAGLQDVDPKRTAETEFANSSHGFMLLTVTSEQMSVDAFNVSNENIYHTEIDR